jgi:predicted DNA-binding protein
MKNKEVVSIRVPIDLKEKLKKQSEKEHRTIQGQVLFFIEKGLSNHSKMVIA